jgi:glycosyltransferase involved in cell wall biosynthesis
MHNQSHLEDQARAVLEENKVAIFIVAYNAEKHIESVLRRIPLWIAERLAEIYVIDDHSPDNTARIASSIEWPSHLAPLRVFRTPYNQGYGGNQRLGYMYALERGIDIVVLLHGDGQYAPESIPQILAPYAEGADAVFGSRFLRGFDSLRGGMPFYKWVGNRILTKIQNFFLGSALSELHSGYRSYSTSALRKIPFPCNSLWFDFDSDIIIQLNAARQKIVEVPIPTHYGDEICHVNGLRYALQCIKGAVKYRLMAYEIFYDPKYDVGDASSYIYTTKRSETSLHHFIRNLSLDPCSKLIDVGGGTGDAVAAAHARRGVAVTCIDRHGGSGQDGIALHNVDLDEEWATQAPIDKYDTAFALDVIEHLHSPEEAVRQLFQCLRSGGKLFASTGNIAYFPLRLLFMIGFFNYGRRGILDFTHRRLFTLGSFRRLLRNAGFIVDEVIGFGPPLRDLAQGAGGVRGFLLRLADSIAFKAARFWPSLFGYQILLVCRRTDAPEDLMGATFGELE